MKFDTIDSAIKDIAKGRMVVVVDDPQRENEGDLVMAAEKATPEAVNFMVKFGRGLVCAPMEGPALDRLGIETMVQAGGGPGRDTAFTVSVDARRGTTTGNMGLSLNAAGPSTSPAVWATAHASICIFQASNPTSKP